LRRSTSSPSIDRAEALGDQVRGVVVRLASGRAGIAERQHVACRLRRPRRVEFERPGRRLGCRRFALE
jgi:hypothetical protein